MKKVEIDLTKNSLNEYGGSYSTLGNSIKLLLGAMFNNIKIPTTVKGTKSEIQSFLDTLVKEKRYMAAYLNYGLDDPRTYRNKAVLDGATRNFERVTGIKWPFK